MKMFNEMSLVSIRKQLVKVGVEMTDEQFYSLTHSELKTIYRKSKKAYKLYTQVDAIVNKKKAPAPAVPMLVEEKRTWPSSLPRRTPLMSRL